jgi:leucyl aminopeptidase
MLTQVVLFENDADLSRISLPSGAVETFLGHVNNSSWYLEVLTAESLTFFVKFGKESLQSDELERVRREGAKVLNRCKELKSNDVQLLVVQNEAQEALDANLGNPLEIVFDSFCEGFLLTSYQYTEFLSPEKKEKSVLQASNEWSSRLQATQKMLDSVCLARELVNRPSNVLTAEELAETFTKWGEKVGFHVEVLHKNQIESQKMGGLLAVNKGSQLPPTFSILTYKPENAINDNPIVLVGKGVVFDTGGLSLKPTPNSMDYMKCDMAGAAVVGSVLHGVASMKLPLYVIGLVPATDNRPGENAICPGDVITQYDGTTVEVLNTDAEGRLILADALSFAKKYNPELVMDFATLTGAAAAAIGPYGAALMGSAPESVKSTLKNLGDLTYERLAELPLWKEYGEEIKGDISDLKNLGKGAGGAQSAAMFLKHFTAYPWLHFDIAGVSFTHSSQHYLTKGGTGFGVRLIIQYLKNYANQ